MNRPARHTLLALVLAAWASASATIALAAEDDVRGKVIDRSATRVDGAAPNTERRDPAATVSSGVRREGTGGPDACRPTGDTAPVPFRITVDGVPLAADGKVSEADRQRCADVALNRADIQVKYDPLQVAPALNITVYPTTVVRGRPVTFSTYSNYAAWIAKGEIRVFEKGRSTQQAPLAVIPAPASGTVEWKPEGAVGAELFFLLRVYDRDGRFDETASRRIDITDWARPEKDGDERRRELLTGYGESSLRLRNIPVTGGSVTVSGSGIREGQVVTALGIRPPIDRDGKFALRQIFPAGPHTVVVSVTDPDGRGTEFRRNLTIADRDWFYVAVADITAGRNSVAGPANIVTADTQHYENRTYVDGRAAFYLKGKIKGEYLITASADTQEQPLQDLFSNFARKDPRSVVSG